MHNTKVTFWPPINLDVPFMFDKYNNLNINNDKNYF